MFVELQEITPERAIEMLSKNTRNRPVNKNQVNRLAKEMHDGRWKVNGDTIRFNGSALVDGQHRLLAVVKSGVPIKSLVVNGLCDDVFETIDIGVKRSPGDTLHVEGFTNSKELAVVLAHVDRYMTGTISSRRQYTNAEIIELSKKYPDVKEYMSDCHHSRGLAPRSLLMACKYLFSKKDREQAEWFINSLITGKDISDADPVYVLREKLMRNAMSKAKFTTPYLFALIIKAWNAHRQKRRVQVLKFCEHGNTEELFPVIA